jgi:catechol 2,3-dioxygenase-like lactoylglutathione lyase family enzyme
MAATFGISHIAMKVSDLDRAVRFYEQAFGTRQYARSERTAQVLGPGPSDVIAFELLPDGAAVDGGLIHFGLRLTGPDEMEGVLARVLAAGGTLKQRGDFGDNQPFAFVLDPEGYEIEIWHENTPHHGPEPAAGG